MKTTLSKKDFLAGTYLIDFHRMLKDKDFVSEFKPNGISWNTVGELFDSTTDDQLVEFLGLGDLEYEFEEWKENFWINVDYDDRSELE